MLKLIDIFFVNSFVFHLKNSEESTNSLILPNFLSGFSGFPAWY